MNMDDVDLVLEQVKAEPSEDLPSSVTDTPALRVGPSLDFSAAQELPPLKVYNSLTGKKMEFKSSAPNRVSWYCCGPTALNTLSIDQARTFQVFDSIRCILETTFRLDLFFVMNITDVDDEIASTAAKIHQDEIEFARGVEELLSAQFKRLCIQPPHVMTRVSEFIPEIIMFCERLIENSVAYVVNGRDVYFDTKAFAEKGYKLGKLHDDGRPTSSPPSPGAEWRGGKRSPADFLLWRTCINPQKERCWDSPWGNGRPAWNVQCSTMAAQLLGKNLDLHSGGCNLRSPHHENSMAQCEAFFEQEQWGTNYLHVGKTSIAPDFRLDLEGVLNNYGCRVFRIFVLSHPYGNDVVLDENQLIMAKETDKSFCHFFEKSHARIRSAGKQAAQKHRWSQQDKDIYASVLRARGAIERFLRDNFDTPNVLMQLSFIAKSVHVYMLDKKNQPKVHLLELIRNYIHFTLTGLGLHYQKAQDTCSCTEIEKGKATLEEKGKQKSKQKAAEKAAVEHKKFSDKKQNFVDEITKVHMPRKYNPVRVLVKFRERVRQAALADNTDSELKKEILGMCDKVTETCIAELGVAIEDKEKKSTWRQVRDIPPEVMHSLYVGLQESKNLADQEKKRGGQDEKKRESK